MVFDVGENCWKIPLITEEGQPAGLFQPESWGGKIIPGRPGPDPQEALFLARYAGDTSYLVYCHKKDTKVEEERKRLEHELKDASLEEKLYWEV